MKANVNYSGKKAFVGVDVHRRSFAVAIVVEEKVVSSFSCPPTESALLDSVSRKVPGAELTFCYEIGFSGFGLGRFLIDNGYPCTVVDPGSVEVSQKARIKTDKKDARNLAIQLSQGRLVSVYVPTLEDELSRLLHRTRQQLVDKRKQTMNQVRGRLHQFGLMPLEHSGVLTIKVVRKALDDAPSRLMLMVESLVSVWEHLNEEIKKLEREIAEVEDVEEELLRSIPGIGLITANTLVSELVDIHRFRTGKQLASYVGLSPSEHSSGDKVKRGGITHQGNARVRTLLIQASWSAVRKDQYFRSMHSKLCATKPSSVAIVAVARKMLMIIRRMLLSGEIYRPVTET